MALILDMIRFEKRDANALRRQPRCLLESSEHGNANPSRCCGACVPRGEDTHGVVAEVMEAWGMLT